MLETPRSMSLRSVQNDTGISKGHRNQLEGKGLPLAKLNIKLDNDDK